MNKIKEYLDALDRQANSVFPNIVYGKAGTVCENPFLLPKYGKISKTIFDTQKFEENLDRAIENGKFENFEKITEFKKMIIAVKMSKLSEVFFNPQKFQEFLETEQGKKSFSNYEDIPSFVELQKISKQNQSKIVTAKIDAAIDKIQELTKETSGFMGKISNKDLIKGAQELSALKKSSFKTVYTKGSIHSLESWAKAAEDKSSPINCR